jgi:hypothetical protein
MKLGVFNLWTEMREQPPSDAFEPAPLFQTAALPVADAASAPRRTTAAKKRKPVVIVDEITAS